MTAPQARPPQILPRPACTPAAVRAVLAANAGDAVLRRYDQDLDMAFEQARTQGDLTPLVQTVRRWWFEVGTFFGPGVNAKLPDEKLLEIAPGFPVFRITST